MRYHEILGEIYYRKNRDDDALRVFNGLKTLDPYFSKKYSLSAKIHIKREDFEAAAKEYEDMAENCPRHSNEATNALLDLVEMAPFEESVYRSLFNVYQKLKQLDGFRSMLMEETVKGVELIVGAKNDYQFGPVILTGIGGTGVEIYQDTVIRMAPIDENDVPGMIAGLKGAELLRGYRGAEPIDTASLARLMQDFSTLVMDLENDIESIDLNPVKCTGTRCVVADARIMLK